MSERSREYTSHMGCEMDKRGMDERWLVDLSWACRTQKRRKYGEPLRTSACADYYALRRGDK